MIALYLKGRMGNQLFQYAFIYATAKKLNTSFYIDKTFQQFTLPRYFQVKKDRFYLFDLIFSVKSYRDVFKYSLKRRFYNLIRKIKRLKEIHFSSEAEISGEISKIANNVIFDGYFQSQKYFSGNETEIRKLFSIKKKFVKKFMDASATLPLNRKIVTIHVRKKDYINTDFCLPIAYYHKAIESIHSLENHYVFISDDITSIKTEFSYLNNIYLSDNTEIIDLQFLMAASICILSNSSFSWWGAFLNENNPVVIAPKYWLGVHTHKEIPCEIIPDAWLKFDYA